MSNKNDEKALLVADEAFSPDSRWNQIVTTILDSYDETVPDNALKAAELLMNGFTTRQVADRLDVTQQSVMGWMKRYPKLAIIVAQGRELLSRWRLGQLEQQFYDAVQVSREILAIPLSGKWMNPETGEMEDVNSKLLGIQAQHARFIISLFTNQQIDVVVKLDENTQELFKAQKSALDYIADQIDTVRKKDETIEATYRLIDPEEDGPLVDEDGNPHHGEIGVVNVDLSGILCHICGGRYSQLGIHIRTKHRMSIESYELTFMLNSGAVSQAQNEYDDMMSADDTNKE